MCKSMQINNLTIASCGHEPWAYDYDRGMFTCEECANKSEVEMALGGDPSLWSYQTGYSHDIIQELDESFWDGFKRGFKNLFNV